MIYQLDYFRRLEANVSFVLESNCGPALNPNGWATLLLPRLSVHGRTFFASGAGVSSPRVRAQPSTALQTETPTFLLGLGVACPSCQCLSLTTCLSANVKRFRELAYENLGPFPPFPPFPPYPPYPPTYQQEEGGVGQEKNNMTCMGLNVC